MADILVRDLDAKVVARLKARAKRNGRSLQNEARLILESVAGYTAREALTVARRRQRSLAGARKIDSAGSSARIAADDCVARVEDFNC